MEDARYFRDHAALCLDIAQQVSDPQIAENLRATAARYFARATTLEQPAEANDLSQALRDENHG